MVDDDSPAFHPDLRRARFMPHTSATRANRRMLRALGRIGRGRAPKGGELVTLSDGVTVRVQRPAATDARTLRPAILHLHGGGLIIGSATQGDALCRRLADELGVVAASVDYRMPPEHPYPTPLEDAHAALRWLTAQPGVDSTRIAVMGESAGGGLAASLAQRVRDEGDMMLAGQVLAYPMLDDRTPVGEGPDPRGLRLWSVRSNRLGWGMYLGAGTKGPAASPLDAATLERAVPARREDLSDLPPAWIGVGTLDLFHDEDVAYAQRLTESGVRCDLHVVEGAYHGFDIAEPSASVSRDFVTRQLDALRTMLRL